MSGLLLELRRQIAHNRRKAAYEERMRASAQEKPQEVFSQKTKETKPDTEIQPEVQERKVNVVSREDFLLSQIDEFRERAKQLQSLLDSRETEAQELQTLVDERQEKADALGQILEERQKKADGFTAEVEKQIDRLIGKELKDSLAQIEEQLTTAKTEISEKVHTENVKCYRNISDLFRSMDERLDKLTVMESRMHPVRIFSLTGMILGIVNLVVLLLVLLVSVGVIAF